MANSLDPIDPNKPQTFNGIQASIGITPILNTFANLSKQKNHPLWNLFLINIETLIRDRKTDVVSDTIANEVITDCSVLAQYIARYCHIVLPPQLKVKPVICFYMTHYEKLPKAFLKEKFPKGTEERWAIRDKIKTLLEKHPFQDFYDETQIVFGEISTKGKWPSRELFDDLCRKFEGLGFRDALMISHVPIDFHLYKYFKSFLILESYTGALKNVKQFGKKVFGDESIPFNKYTHLLFGDKWYLKSYTKASDKRRLKAVAEHDHWTLLPEKGVLASLSKNSPPISLEMLIKPEL